MTFALPGRAPARTSARWLLAVGLVAVPLGVPSTAQAYWTETASGSGMAHVAVLPPPTVTATSPTYSARVDVSWTAPAVPAGMAITGYRVERVVGGAAVDACGTSATTLLPVAQLSCTDTLLPDGAFDYAVTADVGSWTTTGETSVPVVVAADRTGPQLRLSGAAGDNAILDRRSGTDVVFFRPSAATGGGIRIDAELTDDEVGPASAVFPAVATSGWTHAAEEVTTGTGSEPVVTYRSSTFSFVQGASTPTPLTITGADDRANASDAVVTFAADTDGPSGGALRVNGTDATGGGATSMATGTFAIASMTEYAEVPSLTAAGIADTTLRRASASLANGVCDAFGGSEQINASPPVDQAGLPDGCYRYTLTGTDLVGNSASVSVVVVVDTTAPSGGAVRANGTDALPAGSTSMDRTGAWTVARTDYTDVGSGLASSTLVRSQTTLAGGSCGSSWSAAPVVGSPAESGVATGCVRYTLAGVDAAGLSSEVSTTVMVDRAAPTAGALAVNGANASLGGTTSSATASTVTIGARTDYVDAESGLVSSVLKRAFAPMTAGTCGAYDEAAATEVTGGATTTLTGLPDGCHRFTLTGTDLAGNTASVTTTVRLDASAPIGATLTVAGVAGTASGATVSARANTVPVAWTKFTDPESGMNAALVQRTTSTGLANGACVAPYISPSTLSNTLAPASGTSGPALSTTAPRCYRYVLTGTNTLGVTSSVEVTLMFDAIAPTSSGSVTTSATTSTTGTFNVTAVPTFADAQSGMAGVALTRTWAPVVANVCGAYDPATTVTLAATLPIALPIAQTTLPVGCYRYSHTGTNAVGGATTVSRVVRVDSTAPVGGSITANGTAGAVSPGSLSWSTTGAWAVDVVPFTDPESTLTNTLARSVAGTLSNGNCGSFGTAAAVVAPLAETGITGGCIRYVLTGRNSVNLTAPVLTAIVRVETTPPAGGVLTVNTTSANTAGTSSTSPTGTFTIGARTHFTDPHSGMSATSLVRTSGPTCDALDPASAQTITANAPVAQTALAPGCYQYVLSGTNTMGMTSTISTAVTVGP